MSSATDLWAAVEARYDVDGLVTLTNVRDRSATTVNDSVGEKAAQDVIDLFPAYAQADYDASSALHVQAGVLGVIAMLWRRGGSSSTIEQVKWEEVFGDEGVISKLKNVGARARIVPQSNSQTTQSSELTSDNQRVRPWADRANFGGNLPRSLSAES